MHQATPSSAPVKFLTYSWLRPLGGSDPRRGCLEINNGIYELLVLDNGYQLVKPNGTAYDVDAEFHTCSCPDFGWRGRPCKHIRGLRKALAV
jgi:hypothetical protein